MNKRSRWRIKQVHELGTSNQVTRLEAAQRKIRFHSKANMRTAMPTTIPINRALLAFSVIIFIFDNPTTWPDGVLFAAKICVARES
jgi:hypothetical protein